MEMFIQKPIIQMNDLNKISVVKSYKETEADPLEEPIVIGANKKTQDPTLKPNAREDLRNIAFIQV